MTTDRRAGDEGGVAVEFMPDLLDPPSLIFAHRSKYA